MFQSDLRLYLSYLIGRSEALSELAGLLSQSEATLFRSLRDLARQVEAGGCQDVAPIIARITRERRELLARIHDVRDESDIESQLAVTRAAGRPAAEKDWPRSGP